MQALPVRIIKVDMQCCFTWGGALYIGNLQDIAYRILIYRGGGTRVGTFWEGEYLGKGVPQGTGAF